MPSVRWNRYWGERYAWPQDGEEWSGQAAFCGQPYEAWKRALLEAFVRPHLSSEAVALEIAPGHGRWSEYLVEHAGEVHLVDLNASCIDHCRRRFEGREHVRYAVTDGTSLPGLEPGSVDFAWSYDSFVHMERDTIGAYLRELARVLRPGGTAVIHHAGRRHAALWLGSLRRLGLPGRKLYQLLSMGPRGLGDRDGDRSAMSRELFSRLAREAGLELLFQVDSWGEHGQYDCRRFGDVITGLRRPDRSDRALTARGAGARRGPPRPRAGRGG